MSRAFDPRDPFFQKAVAEGYRARSAFKLKEILGSHRPLRKGWKVLDLGAAPGGFLQVLAEQVGPKGLVVGVDTTPVRPFPDIPWIVTLQEDAQDPALLESLRAHSPLFDAVISDMAPSTTGSKSTDTARSHVLVERAFEIADELLRPGGLFLAKVFMGPGFDELLKRMRGDFAKVRVARPKATRSRSKECFLVATGRRR